MTDIAGYRAGGGALTTPPAPQSLASILTNKAPLLNTPGSDVEEPLYYGKFNSSVNAAESQFYFAKDRIDFQGSRTLDSQQNVYIPNRYFAGNVWLNLRLNPNPMWRTAAFEDDTQPYFCMEQGWGFSCIAALTYYLGASSVSNVTIDGVSNLSVALAACETAEKRQTMLDYAGQFLWSSKNNVNEPGALGNLAPPANAKLLFRNFTDFDSGTAAVEGVTINSGRDARFTNALVPIRLPWASTCHLQSRLPFDTNLLNQPINVQIAFRKPPIRTLSDFFTAETDPYGTMATVADTMQLVYEQVELIDKSLSLRDDLLAQPDFNVSLPFQFFQTMSYPATYTSSLGAGNPKYNISSMLNSDLTTILFSLTEPVNLTQYGNYADFVTLNDLTLELNGQQFSVFQVNNYTPFSASRQIGAPGVPYHPVLLRTNNNAAAAQTANAAAVPAQVVVGNSPKDGPVYMNKELGVYEFNMSMLRALMNESHLVNTPRFTNQQFQVSFTIPNAFNARCFQYGITDASASSVPVSYRMNITYCYNAVFQVGGAGGTSTLYTT